MKFKKISFAFAASMILAACGGGTTSSSSTSSTSSGGSSSSSEEQSISLIDGFGYDSLSGRTRKATYSSYISYLPSSLNTAVTMQAENGEHIANFVDGLMENDRFGNLVPALASSYSMAEDGTSWTFNLKSGVKWMTSAGTQYKDKVVSPEDFVTAARYACNFETGAEAYYLYTMIIEGANELWLATAARFAYRAAGLSGDNLITQIGNYLKERAQSGIAGLNEDPNVYNNSAYINSILNYEKLGIVTTESSITYNLIQPAEYFASMLTYTPFLPINQEFISEVGLNNFGSDKTKLLYCGGYIIDEWQALGTRITYSVNPEYWDRDTIKTTRIILNKLPENVGNSFARQEYESGKIDGFGVSSMDEAGWRQYVTGPNGTGTLRNPYSEEAFSNLGEGDKSTFMFYLNQDRKTDSSGMYNSMLTRDDVSNANKALRYSYFRKAVLSSLDVPTYNYRNGTTEETRNQYTVNTYTPRYFVYDDQGKDYYDYYIEEYAEYHNMSVEDANRKLEPMQSSGMKLSVEESQQLIKDAIAQLKIDDPSITYPIQLEYVGLYFDDDSREYDRAFIEGTNEALNGCVMDRDYQINEGLPVCPNGGNNVDVKIVNNTKVTQSNTYLDMSDRRAFTLFISGWGPDYADPLTFANTVTLGGDLADHFGITTESALSDETEAKFETYGQMVKEANLVFGDKATRFEKFAEAEVYMMEELGLLRPLYQVGQGYSVTISKIIPYRTSRASYGLSNYKYKGLEVLTTVLTAAERATLKAEWERQRAESI